MMGSEGAQVLAVRDATKVYAGTEALAGVSLSVADGEIVGLLGPNGAGKSTLLEAIVGARPLDGGSIAVCGVDVRRDRAGTAEKVALQPQGSALFKHLTVRECLRLWGELYPAALTVAEALACVDLGEQAEKQVRSLSGGQQQRLRLGLALIGDTDLVMFDEPTVGLDPVVRDQVWDVIRARSARGAVLLATQMMDEAEALCDRVVILVRGRILCEGTVDDLIGTHGHDGSATFLTEHPVAESRLCELDGVVWASVRTVGRDHSVRLVTRDQGATRSAIARAGLDARRYRSGGPSFRDVFLTVVGEAAVGAENQEETT